MGDRVLICGDREWGLLPRHREAMQRFIDSLPEGTVVIHGDARGADRMAGEMAEARGLRVLAFPADWSRGKGAGPRRNQQMLDEGFPRRVAYAHDDLENSRGTADMVRRSRLAGLPVERIK